MDNHTLIRILGQTPETKLRLLGFAESAEEPATPIWKLEKKRQQELQEATNEASNYISATRRAEPGGTEDSNAPLRLTALMELTEERPPKISVVIRKLNRGDNAKDRAWFEELLRKTVPERAWEILQLDDEAEQVLSFAVRFRIDHFPICEDYLQMQMEWRQEEPEYEYEEGGPYSLLRDGIPFELMGFTWDELHAMWDWHQRRNGLAALALLSPPEGHDHWTLRLLAGKVVELGLTPSMSH